MVRKMKALLIGHIGLIAVAIAYSPLSSRNNHRCIHILQRCHMMEKKVLTFESSIPLSNVQQSLQQRFKISKKVIHSKRTSFIIAMRRLLWSAFSIMVISLFRPLKAIASGGPIGAPIKSQFTPLQGAVLWCTLFLFSATLHSAESAITKISSWKVQEFAEDEGPQSPFAYLSSNLTKLLSTILLITTACSIYSTALFVATASEVFPKVSLGLITAILTAVTLFFGEILPKAMAVSNSELVARKLVPILSRIAVVLYPITTVVTTMSDLVLRLSGMRASNDEKEDDVSEDMLRMVVDEAQRSNTGIDSGEGRMIKAVLDMQDKAVGKIMQPRVDIVAVPEEATATEILKIVVENRYSRIPVYRGDVDNIVGIVYSKDLLDVFSKTLASDDDNMSEENDEGTSSSNIDNETIHSNNNNLRNHKKNNKENNGKNGRNIRNKSKYSKGSSDIYKSITLDDVSEPISWSQLTAAAIMEDTYFIPETMMVWTALQEMRKRRLHMAIVVDEYGGTAGLVTFEDCLEEVVGEIYDEDDDEEEVVERQNITRNSDGTFEMKGVAALDDVCEALGLELPESDLDEHSTVGGFLCSQAGAIPGEGDTLEFSSYRFTIKEVEDNRRILSLSAEKLGPEGKELKGKDSNGNDASTEKEKREDFSLPFLKLRGSNNGDSTKVVEYETSNSDFCGTSDKEVNGEGELTFVDGVWVGVDVDKKE